MSLLESLRITSSGRPHYLDNEFDISIQPISSISFSNNLVYFPSTGKINIHITPLRICLVPHNRHDSHYFISWKNVEKTQEIAGFSIFSSPKIIFYCRIEGKKEISCVITCELESSGSLKAISDAIKHSLTAKVYLTTPVSSSGQNSEDVSPVSKPVATILKAGTVGIGSIVRDVQRKQKVEETMVQNAFSDLEPLMKQAQEMVQMATKISKYMADHAASDSDQNTFSSLLISLGADLSLAGAVSKEGSGVSFHHELAKQMHDVLLKPVEMRGGLISLTDVFCILNLARGSDYLAPDDVLIAARLLSTVPAPDKLSLHVFEDGTMAIRSNMADPTVMANKISLMCPCTEIGAASKLGVSVALARKVLEHGEQKGVFVRDETLESTRFFKNTVFV